MKSREDKIANYILYTIIIIFVIGSFFWYNAMNKEEVQTLAQETSK
jgi:hypothetical protein